MNKQRSFTLIELLVVIGIIGILGSIILISMTGVREKARIAKALQFSQSLHNTIGAYAVGIWSFETIEPGNIVLDASGYRNDGTLYPELSPPTITEGININGGTTGKALLFDGSTNYVQIISFSLNNSTEQTRCMWIKPNVDSDQLVFSSYNGRGPISVNSDNRIRVDLSGGGGSMRYFSTNTVQDGVWTHVCGVTNSDLDINVARVAGDCDIYINGALEIKSTLVTGANLDEFTTYYIGTYNPTSFFFNGLIDEVRIYDRTLTLAEIQKHYAEGFKKYKLVEK